MTGGGSGWSGIQDEDAVFQRQAAHMLAELRRDPATRLVPAMSLLGQSHPMPEALRRRIALLPEGVHELNDVGLDDASTETDIFVGITSTAGSRIELAYDVRPFEAFDAAARVLGVATSDAVAARV